MKRTLLPAQADVLDAIFGTGFRDIIQCNLCGQSSVNDRLEMGLMVNLVDETDHGRLTEHIENNFASQELEGYRCGNCQAMDQCRKRPVIHEPAQLLMVVLQRFKMKGSTSVKVIQEIPFDHVLSLTAYLGPDAPSPLNYVLRAVIHHQHVDADWDASGDLISTAEMGHYRTDVIAPSGRWRQLEDAVFRKVPSRRVLNPGGNWTPYVLFYERVPPGEVVLEYETPSEDDDQGNSGGKKKKVNQKKGGAKKGNKKTAGATTGTNQTAGATTGTNLTAGAKTATNPTAGANTATIQMTGAKTATHPTAGAKTATHPTAGAKTATHQTAGATTATNPTAGATTATHPTAGATTGTVPMIQKAGAAVEGLPGFKMVDMNWRGDIWLGSNSIFPFGRFTPRTVAQPV
ncbi:MAG: hypothetical protein M1826_002642 [Phylliscum demangeonii]|nr:MAG: hypothetical protein M1826_002642 [Phylliscum demangeonii]